MTASPVVTRGAERGREWLRANNLPWSDEIPLEACGGEFADGGHYGVEVPVVNSFKVLQATLGRLQEEGLPVTRFNETLGAFLISDAEVQHPLAPSPDTRRSARPLSSPHV